MDRKLLGIRFQVKVEENVVREFVRRRHINLRLRRMRSLAKTVKKKASVVNSSYFKVERLSATRVGSDWQFKRYKMLARGTIAGIRVYGTALVLGHYFSTFDREDATGGFKEALAIRDGIVSDVKTTLSQLLNTWHIIYGKDKS